MTVQRPSRGKAGECDIRTLMEKVYSIEARGRMACSTMPTGLVSIDVALPHGGLQTGALHEWFGTADETGTSRRAGWTPPLLLLVHLARAAYRAGRMAVWIGRRAWPYSHPLAGGDRSLLAASLFVDPPDNASRLWAIDAAMRCPGVVVLADGSTLDAAGSRRLQLAAEAGGSIGLLVRPPHERAELSVAATRWAVSRAQAGDEGPRWVISLARSKGLDSILTQQRSWTVERVNCGGLVVVSPDVAERSDAAAAAS